MLRTVAIVSGRPWRWQPDDGAAGWVTVAAYLVVAAMATIAWRRCRRADLAVRPPRAVRWTWAVVAVAMVCFGVGKQFGLQNHFVDQFRGAAWTEGWYADRRPVQAVVVLCVAAAGAVAAVRIARILRPVRQQVGGAVLGLAVLVVFVAIRAVSLHQIDHLLARGSVQTGTFIELVCIGTIGWSTARYLRRGEISA